MVERVNPQVDCKLLDTILLEGIWLKVSRKPLILEVRKPELAGGYLGGGIQKTANSGGSQTRIGPRGVGGGIQNLSCPEV